MGRPKSDLLSAVGTMFEILKGIVNEVIALGGTDNDVRLIIKNQELRRKIAELIIAARPGATSKPANIEYVTPLVDTDVPERLVQIVAKWRKLARSLNYTGPVVWRVKVGFTLKAHAPKAGPCYDGFKSLQDWSLANDEPTQDAIAFWVPRLLVNSTSKTVEEQRVLMADVRVCFELPAHHLVDFGSAALLSALVFAHFKLTGERVPVNQFWVRTDTLHADGLRLSVGSFGAGGLDCGDWWGEDRGGYIGAFPLGVELGH